MGKSGRLIQTWLAIAATAAATAGALVAHQPILAAASTTPVEPDITFLAGDNPSGTEPLTVGTDAIVGRFDDLDNVAPQISRANPLTDEQIPTCGDASVYTATIDWGDGSAPSDGTVSCDSSAKAQYMVQPSPDNEHTYLDSGTYNITITITDGSDDADKGQTATATIADANILAPRVITISGAEGKGVGFTTYFGDEGSGFHTIDSGLSAKVEWGDGTSSDGTVSAIVGGDCECNVQVSASHVYDAKAGGGSYTGSVTLNDDGGSHASVQLTAAITDAALTGSGKSVTMTGGQAATATVASFTDAAGAQAAAADFTASIKWGDGATSNGTVTKTGSGAFDISGTHTYATAGTKSLTITVTDEEGQSLSMSAAVTVPALPPTGHPSSPVSPISPLAAWLGLVLAAAGLAAIAMGVRRARLG